MLYKIHKMYIIYNLFNVKGYIRIGSFILSTYVWIPFIYLCLWKIDKVNEMYGKIDVVKYFKCMYGTDMIDVKNHIFL